jgi:pimeloyl-ACP methyl ester carboxylesterase/DNA-binding winged helix-turn-helix (wHTH) protein
LTLPFLWRFCFPLVFHFPLGKLVFVGSVLCRPGKNTMFVFADTILDPYRREVRRRGDLVPLEPQVFDLLEFLIRSRSHVATKDELLANVWGGRIVSDSTISVRINAARQAIGDNGKEQRFIRTFPRKGFRFVADVREEFREPPGGPTPGRTLPVNATGYGADAQELRFCRTSDGVNIALACVGQGTVLVRTATWLNHLEYEWHSPIRSPFLRFLAERFRLVRYDGRGKGLSDRNAPDVSFDGFLRDLDAVVEALGIRRYALMGVSQGAPIAIAHAARYPERVSALVLHGAYAQGRNKRSAAVERETAQALLSIMRQGWGDEGSAFMRAFSSVYLPGGTREQISWFAELQRMATSAETAARLRVACDDIDVTHLLEKVSCPTLVLHCRNDGVVPFDEGRRLAASVARAKFVPLASENHILLEGEPAWETFIGSITNFLDNVT